MDQRADGQAKTFNGCIVPAINSNYVKTVIPYIKSATREICVAMYLWNWYSFRGNAPMQRLSYQFLAAARRGVKVRVILNLDHVGGNLSRINGQTANELRRAGIIVKLDTMSQVLHAKFVIIDQKIIILGSHNYSEKAINSNIETSCIIESPEVVPEYQKLFNTLFERI